MYAIDDRRERALLVGRNIRLARKLAGLTQQRLALVLEMERHWLSAWETGVNEPSPRNLNRVARAVSQPLHFFFAEHDEAS